MKVGDVIEGRYLVEDLLGEGGMARVFRVRHVGLGSVHALKVLNSDLADRVEVRNRFASEGKIQAQIRHPNIVAVTEVVAEPGLYGLVMEYVEGQPMDAYLSTLSTPPDAELVRTFMVPVLEAMALAHARGVVHRDLKPENILVGRDPHGRPWPRVSDFGIAKVRQEAEEARATRTGTSMGTRGYMSPEQIKSSKDVSPRSDIFSLGATLYELATLEQAFPGESDYEVMDRIVHERFTPPEQVHPTIDPRIAETIAIALRADPQARFATCEEFSAYLRGESITAPAPVTEPTTVPARVPARLRRDTAPDTASGILELQTFEPIPVGSPAELPPPLASSVFEAEIASPEQAVTLWNRVLDWATDWPKPVRETLKFTRAERHPLLRLTLRTTFEKRERKMRDMPFPAGADVPEPATEVSERDPFEIRLPTATEPFERAESFVLAGSVTVRSCTACRAKGDIMCAECAGQGASKCTSCAGTGTISCVLCDGLGTVQKAAGEGLEICPSCNGSNVARCLSTGCKDGQIACQVCEGVGARTCRFCAGSGRMAKAALVTRQACVGEGVAWVHLGLPPPVLAGLEALSEEGVVELAAILEGGTASLDFRLQPFLQEAERFGAANLRHPDPAWTPTRREVELRRFQAWRVTYTSSAGEHEAWLLGASGAVVGETTPVGAWRTRLLEEVEGLVTAGDASGLRSSHLADAFDPEDQRVAELGQRLATAIGARWDGGQVALARQLRDSAPMALAPALNRALAHREAVFQAQRSRRQRGWLFAASVAGLGVAAAVAAALGLVAH